MENRPPVSMKKIDAKATTEKTRRLL